MDLTPRQEDHEAKMARADLFKLAQYSFKLFKMIHEDQELEGWVQAKITKAADYIASVYHYMEYEMKFSEYGEKLENSDVYHQMSESQRVAIETMLTEAKETMKKLTAAQAKKLKKKGSKVDEASKPDFADLDDDGDEEEPMKKAAKDAKKEKKVKEGFPTVDDAKKRHEQEKGTGKFDKKETGDGRTQYTRKASTFTDGGDDSDVKAAKKKDKKVKEDDDRLTYNRKPDGSSSVSSSTGRVQATLDQGKMSVSPAKPQGGQDTQPLPPGTTPEKAKKDPRYKTDPKFKKEVDAAMQIGVNEASKKAKKDYDKDGKIESGKDEYLGSKIAAAKKAGKMEEASKKCNHSDKGKSCPVHGLKECGSMYESKVEESHDPIYKLNVVKANEKSGQLKITAWLRQETGLPRDAYVYFDDADLVYGEKTIVPEALVNPKLKMKDLVVALKKAIREEETEGGDMYEASKPSAGMSKGAKSALVKKATAGKDIGKPGKSFDKVAAKAGGGEKGKKIAAAAMWKNAAKESVELKPVVVAESAEMARLKHLTKFLNG